MTSSLRDTLRIVPYPHPTLRYVSKPVKRVDTELRATVQRMIELMYEARGVGLAANQVDLPLRLFVCNLAGKPDDGEEQVFINPVLQRPKGTAEAEEGCLSLPGVYADVTRPERIRLHAYNLQGEEIDTELSGFAARVVQHEVDHLNGVLFIDRLHPSARADVADQLDELQTVYESQLRVGGFLSDEKVLARRQELEKRYA